MEPPSGILTFTTNGKTHLEIENEFGEMLERVKKQAVADDRKKRER
jgi:hypothetical protein